MDIPWYRQSMERDGVIIYERYDRLNQGWWIRVGEDSEAVRFFPRLSSPLGLNHLLAVTEWLKECREYRLASEPTRA